MVGAPPVQVPDRALHVLVAVPVAQELLQVLVVEN
jgi:hypothetical protein